MTMCERVAQHLAAAPGTGSVDAATLAHVDECEHCSARIVADILSPPGHAPAPPAGFAHLVAVRAQTTLTPPPVGSRRGLWAALVIVALDMVGLGIWMSSGEALSQALGAASVPVATAGLLVLAEAAIVAGGWLVLAQAPPTRQRT